MKSFYSRKPKHNCTTCEEPLFFKKDWEKCKKCSDIFCTKHIYQYVDGNNISITKNSPQLCRNCYRETYNN